MSNSSPTAEPTPMQGPDEKDAPMADSKPQSGVGYVTGLKLALIVGSVALACFLMLLDTMIISTVSSSNSGAPSRLATDRCVKAIPRITDTFNSLPDVGWYASAYQFGRFAISYNPG